METPSPFPERPSPRNAFDRGFSNGSRQAPAVSREAALFATRKTSLGWMLAAATRRGVCAVSLGDDPEALVSRLRADFPRAGHAAPADGATSLDATVEAVAEAIETPGAAWRLPLDIRATPFQRRVWEAVREIPVGTTSTYQAIAQRVGDGATAQDVGEACAPCPFAVVVPCHRVIRSDGRLPGCWWNAPWARVLLQREYEAAPGPDSLFQAAR